MKKVFNKSAFVISFLLIIIGVMTCIGIPFFFYFYLFFTGLIFSYYFFSKTEFNRLVFILLTSPFWSSCILVFICGILALMSVPVRLWVIWIPILILIVLVIKYPPNFKNMQIKFQFIDLILLVIGVLSLASHVYSIRSFSAPILHDPIAHSAWAKEIFNTGYINYFYSPGLHILSALGMMADGVNVSKYVLILTNLFNALCYLPVYLFVANYFKDKKFALAFCFVLCCCRLPIQIFLGCWQKRFSYGNPYRILTLIFCIFKNQRY